MIPSRTAKQSCTIMYRCILYGGSLIKVILRIYSIGSGLPLRSMRPLTKSLQLCYHMQACVTSSRLPKEYTSTY